MTNEYPEHEKMHAVVDQSQAIGEFLDWLADTHDVILCVIDGLEFMPYRRGINQMLAEFFEIDLQKIDNEKRAMLALLRGET